jgi:hypothetical protein
MKYNLDLLVEHAEKSVLLSEKNSSKLTQEILNLEGMSGNKTRHLYNNICNLDGANYLEVGTWKGSSFISSIYKNNIKSIAIDNWSEFDGPKEEFLKNVEFFCPESDYAFIEKDSFQITKEEVTRTLPSVDIFLYDGCHKYESHKNAIVHFSKFLSKFSIIIIDDWRNDDLWERVQRGTYDGLKESGLIVHRKFEKITKQELTGRQEYWNGFGMFICERSDV